MIIFYVFKFCFFLFILNINGIIFLLIDFVFEEYFVWFFFLILEWMNIILFYYWFIFCMVFVVYIIICKFFEIYNIFIFNFFYYIFRWVYFSIVDINYLIIWGKYIWMFCWFFNSGMYRIFFYLWVFFFKIIVCYFLNWEINYRVEIYFIKW